MVLCHDRPNRLWQVKKIAKAHAYPRGVHSVVECSYRLGSANWIYVVV